MHRDAWTSLEAEVATLPLEVRVERLRHFLNANRTHVEARLSLALTLWASLQSEDALIQVKQVLDQEPGHAVARGIYFMMLELSGAWEELLVEAECAAAIDPLDQQANSSRTFALIETSRFAEACVEREAFADHLLQATDQPRTKLTRLLSADRLEEARALIAATPDAPSLFGTLDFDRFAAAGKLKPGTPQPQAVDTPRRLVLALTVRDELELIATNLAWHFAQGVDAVIVTDNGSVDGTRELLAEISSKAPVFVLDEPTQDMDQARWSTRMVWLAREALGADWVILADADEFWAPHAGTLAAVIEEATRGVFAQATTLHLSSQLLLMDLEAGKAGQPTLPNATRRFQRPLPRLDYAPSGWDTSMAPWMVQFDKVWVRAGCWPLVAHGNHAAYTANPLVVPVTGAIGLHASVRSFELFERKLIRFAEGFARNTAPNDRTNGAIWVQGLPEWRIRGTIPQLYARSVFGHPFHHWAEAEGRIVPEHRVATLAANLPPWPGAGLTAAEHARIAASLADLADRLPRFLA
ncbi:MAG: glycosyltransferase family 2 protein [Alphaproteobacteria bacterium]|nr:MAG: glycosyltransferase family 2 protein [Alphaproteobacteria bacterium]